MLYPSIHQLTNNGETNAYAFVIAAAKRAREIADEAKDKDEILELSPLKLAVADFAEGKTRVKR